MPSKSEQQEKTMRAAAHNKEYADKMHIPQEVAREYEKVDKAKRNEERKKDK